MGGGGSPRSAAAIQADTSSLEDVFQNYRARRAGIVKALTKDVDEFFKQCDPGKENLCLYGLPDETWEVRLPDDLVPPELPEPPIGINFARDGIALTEWLLLVAVHSDSWLMSVAFYNGACYSFDKQARDKLFTMINGLTTVFQEVSKFLKNQSVDPKGGGKNKLGSEPEPQKQSNSSTKLAANQAAPKHEDEEEEEGAAADGDEDQGSTLWLCGACGEAYTKDEFWICCDVCETWFHGECVSVTPAMAERIPRYECPDCNCKRVKVSRG